MTAVVARHFGVGERRRRLLTRHHLAARLDGDEAAGSVERVAGDLVGIHSTDPATVYLSLYNRISGFTVAHLDAALFERRSLMRILGMRRTMFVVPLDLAAVVDASCTRALIPNERRRTVQLMQAEGITDAACRVTLAFLRTAGEPFAARSLTPAVPQLRMQVTMAAGKQYSARPAITNRVLLHLSTEGHIVRTRPLGSWVSSQYRWTPTVDWFGPLAVVEEPDARRELVRRWLGTYGPGTITDIAWWTKWPKRDVVAALSEIGAIGVTVEPAPGGGAVPAWLLADDLDDTGYQSAIADGTPSVQLLPGLDSAIMGWKERGWYLGPHAPLLFDRNGNAGPIVLVDGVAVGVWAQRAGGRVVTELLETVDASVSDRVDALADELTTWFDGVRVTPRFPNPLERRLAND